MPNIFDQFDAASEAKDLATSFGVGSNQLLKTVGDVYGLATGDMDNVVSRQGRENIDYLQRGKSEKLRQAEARRKTAVDAEEGTVNQALKYAKETFTDPRLLLSGTAEAVPSLVGAGGIGAGARVAAGRVLGKKGAETAAKIGVGAAVAAGSGQQGASVGAEQYSEVADILKKMPDEQAMEVPEIARLMSENGYSLEKAKNALTLNLARSTGALAAIASATTQMVPGGRTIESALVGGAGKKAAGGTLARRGIGAAMGALGEGVQEGAEEGSGAVAKNVLARAVEPEREITKGVGEAMGAGFSNAAPLGAAAGAASRPSRPVPVGETTAGKSGEPQASDATNNIPVLESTTDLPSISLRDIENMSPEEFAAAIDVRDAASRGGKPRPEDVTSLETVRPGSVQESDTTIIPVQEALDEWRNQNPDVGLSVTVVNDPNMRNTRNYGIRGYFDPNTGEVVINSAFTKPFEVESVVNHEWSHHTLASDEGRAALAEFATRDIPATELSDLAKRYPNADNLTLVEEWIARNQEKSPGVFARIVAKIREWLNGKLGINMTNEEAARVMLRTLRERGAPVAEGSGEMRQSTTEQPVGEPESVRRDPGRSGMMASPSVVDINYDRAKRNLTSSDQARFRSDVEGFAPEATVYNAVGDWADGAENSVAAVFKDVRSSQELRQLAANAGLTGDQKAALWWRVEENGPDAIHQVTWPKEITMDEARQAMIDAGIENRTLIQTRDGVMGFVFDQGQQNLSKIDKLYESSTNPSTQSSPATGEFVGSWNSRIEGKRAYRNVLGLPTKTPESEGVSGLGVRSRGDAETGAETGSEPERSSVLAKQPIRESLTSDQIDAVDKRQIRELDIDDLVSRGILTDQNGKLLDELRSTSGGDSRIEVVNPEDLPPRAAAVYDPNTNTIRVSKDGKLDLGRVLMHEYTHALTFMGLKYADERMTSSGDIISATPRPGVDIRDLREASRQMDDLFSTAGKAANDLGKKFYGLTNRMEFVAEAFSSKKFQEFLSSIPSTKGGKQSLFDQFIAIVKKILGTENDSLLTDVITATDPFVGAKKRVTGTLMVSPPEPSPRPVQPPTDLRTAWWSTIREDRPALPDEPERSSVLAKQPIRESVTDKPVGETALEDAKTLTFKNQIEVSKYLGDLLKKEFPNGLDGRSPEDRANLADMFDRELSLALTIPENADAIGWYSREMQKVFEVLRSPELDFKLDDSTNRGIFNAILAVTSNGQKVVPQFLKTAQLYEKWLKTGKIPPVGKWGGERNKAIKGHLKFLNQLIEAVGPEQTVGFLTSEQSLGDHLTNLYGMVAEAQNLPAEASVADQKAAVKKYLKTTMPSGELVDYNTVGAAVLGPKLGGGFFANLYGKFDRLTMDRWFMRTFHRLTGRLGLQRTDAIEGVLKEARSEAADVLPEDVSDEEILQEINTTGKQAFKNYKSIKNRLKENPDDTEALSQDLMRRLYNRYTKAKSGLFDAPDNGGHRNFIRDVVNDVQKRRAERGEENIDTSDIQAILWYLEKDIWNQLRKKNEVDEVADADAQDDEDDGDIGDTAGRVSYSDGARELYRQKTRREFQFQNESAKNQVLRRE